MKSFNLYIIPMVLFLNVAICQVTYAQLERSTVLLPSSIGYDAYEKMTSITFETVSPLPSNSFLDKGSEKLLLYFTIKENRLENNTCYIDLKNTENTQVAQLQLKGDLLNKSLVTFDINPKEFEKMKNGKTTYTISYSGNCFTQSTTPLIKFYEDRNINDTISLSNQPKLVAFYQLTSKPHREDWSQALGDAQQTNSVDWKLDYMPASIAVNETYGVVSGKLTDATLIADKINIFNNNPLTFASKGDNTQVTYWATTSIQNTTKLSPVWSQSLKRAAPKFLPLIAENKYLYYFTGGNDPNTQMVILDLNQSGQLVDTKRINDINVGNTKISVIENTITMGYDGSLYLPTNTGVVALTPYPVLKPKWYFNAISSFGPVSLTKDEQIACFIKLEGTKAKLILVDNVTGRTLAQLSLDGTYNKLDIPPILIQTLTGTKFNALVLNKNSNADKLFGFEIDYSDGLSVSPKVWIDGPDNAIQYQPILTPKDNKVYVFNNKGKEIITIDTENKKTTFKSKNPDNYLNAYLGAYYDALPIVVSNADNGVISRKNDFNIDGMNALTYYIKNAKSRPFFGPDGSVYSINGDNSLNRYCPLPLTDNTPEKIISSVNSKTTYGHNKKIVLKAQSVSSTIDAQFVSKTFGFEKGFRVKKGAVLTFQINK